MIDKEDIAIHERKSTAVEGAREITATLQMHTMAITLDDARPEISGFECDRLKYKILQAIYGDIVDELNLIRRELHHTPRGMLRERILALINKIYPPMQPEDI